MLSTSSAILIFISGASFGVGFGMWLAALFRAQQHAADPLSNANQDDPRLSDAMSGSFHSTIYASEGHRDHV